MPFPEFHVYKIKELKACHPELTPKLQIHSTTKDCSSDFSCSCWPLGNTERSPQDHLCSSDSLHPKRGGWCMRPLVEAL